MTRIADNDEQASLGGEAMGIEALDQILTLDDHIEAVKKEQQEALAAYQKEQQDKLTAATEAAKAEIEASEQQHSAAAEEELAQKKQQITAAFDKRHAQQKDYFRTHFDEFVKTVKEEVLKQYGSN